MIEKAYNFVVIYLACNRGKRINVYQAKLGVNCTVQSSPASSVSLATFTRTTCRPAHFTSTLLRAEGYSITTPIRFYSWCTCESSNSTCKRALALWRSKGHQGDFVCRVVFGQHNVFPQQICAVCCINESRPQTRVRKVTRFPAKHGTTTLGSTRAVYRNLGDSCQRGVICSWSADSITASVTTSLKTYSLDVSVHIFKMWRTLKYINK